MSASLVHHSGQRKLALEIKVPVPSQNVAGSPLAPSLPVPLAPPPHAGTSRSAASCLSLQLVLMEIRGCVSQSCAPFRARQICSSILAAPTGTDNPCQCSGLPGLEPECRSPSVPRPPPSNKKRTIQRLNVHASIDLSFIEQFFIFNHVICALFEKCVSLLVVFNSKIFC